MKKTFRYLFVAAAISLAGCQGNTQNQHNAAVIEQINNNDLYQFVDQKAGKILATGFNAGDGYGEVWIRDFNTFAVSVFRRSKTVLISFKDWLENAFKSLKSLMLLDFITLRI